MGKRRTSGKLEHIFETASLTDSCSSVKPEVSIIRRGEDDENWRAWQGIKAEPRVNTFSEERLRNALSACDPAAIADWYRYKQNGCIGNLDIERS